MSPYVLPYFRGLPGRGRGEDGTQRRKIRLPLALSRDGTGRPGRRKHSIFSFVQFPHPSATPGLSHLAIARGDYSTFEHMVKSEPKPTFFLRKRQKTQPNMFFGAMVKDC